jgi:hypothetical protein
VTDTTLPLSSTYFSVTQYDGDLCAIETVNLDAVCFTFRNMIGDFASDIHFLGSALWPSGYESLSMGTTFCLIGPFCCAVPVGSYRCRECSAVIIDCRENTGFKSSAIPIVLTDEMKSSPHTCICSHEKSCKGLGTPSGQQENSINS